MADDLVKYSNNFIEAVHKLETTQKKLMIVLSQNAQKLRRSYSSEGDLIFNVSAKDICESAGIHFESETVLDAISKLQERVIKVREGKDKWKSFQVLGETEYDDGAMRVRINKSMLPFIVDLNDKWTAYRLLNIRKLRSAYSIRLYEILKSHQDLGRRHVHLDELRQMLDCESKFLQYSDFKREVLQRAQKELAKNCDIKFDFIEKKLGHKVDSILFNISPNRIFEIDEDAEPVLPGMETEIYDVDLERKWQEIVTYLKAELGVTKDPDNLIKEVRKKKLINALEAREAIIEFVSGPLSEEIKKKKIGPPLVVCNIESRAADWYLSEKQRKTKEKLLKEQQTAIEMAERRKKEEEERERKKRFEDFKNLSLEEQSEIHTRAKKEHGDYDGFPKLDELKEDNFFVWISDEVFNETNYTNKKRIAASETNNNKKRYDRFRNLPDYYQTEIIRSIVDKEDFRELNEIDEVYFMRFIAEDKFEKIMKEIDHVYLKDYKEFTELYKESKNSKINLDILNFMEKLGMASTFFYSLFHPLGESEFFNEEEMEKILNEEKAQPQ